LVDITCGLGEGLRAHQSGGRGNVERWSKPVTQGVYVGQRLSFGAAGKARSQIVAKVANRTREIRPSGMRGGLAETWAMVEAKRARTAETPTRPSFNLRLCALYFYPTAT
jgi:hypothetical protein